MLDPSRYSLDAATVGFRKRMGQSVPMDSFKKALQNQTDAIKVRRELEETPITEIHVMGGGLYGIASDEKTKTYARQQRQINGYVLRSFLANGGPIQLPPKHGEGLMATPMNVGLTQYGGYNSTVGNYVSSFTEPLQAPLDNNTMLLARSGVMAANESASNPYARLQFMLNMKNTQAQINDNQAAFLESRQYNKQSDIAKSLREEQSRAFRGNGGSKRAAKRERARSREGRPIIPSMAEEERQQRAEENEDEVDFFAEGLKAPGAYEEKEEYPGYEGFGQLIRDIRASSAASAAAAPAGRKVGVTMSVDGAGNNQEIQSNFERQALAGANKTNRKEMLAAQKGGFGKGVDTPTTPFNPVTPIKSFSSPGNVVEGRQTSILPGMESVRNTRLETAVYSNTSGGQKKAVTASPEVKKNVKALAVLSNLRSKKSKTQDIS